MKNYNAALLAQDLASALPKWERLDQDWWINAAWHSMELCGSFVVISHVSSTGQNVIFKRDNYLI